MDWCCVAFPKAAFETATDPPRYCSLEFLLYSGSQRTAILVDKDSTEKVDPVPMVNFVLLFVDTISRKLMLENFALQRDDKSA